MEFSKPELNSSYRSEWVKPSGGGLEAPYTLTDLYLDSVLSQDVIPPELLLTFDLADPMAFVNALADNWQDVVTHNWRLTTSFVFGAIVAILLPIIGIIWCSCLCCKKNKEEQPRKSGDKWSVCIQGSLLLVLTLMSWLCLIWYCGADIVAQTESEKLAGRIGVAIDDASLYRANAVAQTRHLTDNNYVELRTAVESEIFEGADRFEDILNDVTNGTEVNFYELVGIVGFLSDTTTNYDANMAEIEASVAALNDPAAKEMQASVTEIQGSEDLTTILAAFPDGQYDNLELLRSSLKVDTTKIPAVDLSQIQIPLGAATALENLYIQLNDGLTLMTNFDEDFNNTYSQEIVVIMEELGRVINEEVEKILAELDNLQFEELETVEEDIDTFMTKWSALIFGLLLIPFCILVVVTILYFVGFVCGSAGKVGGASKKHGSNCLTAGTVIFFIVAILVWAVCVVLFLAGALTQHFGCTTLEDPANSELYPVFEKEINELFHNNFEDTPGFENVNFSLPEILDSCQNNAGIYKVMHMDLVFNTSELLNWESQAGLDGVIADITILVNDTINEIVVAADIPPLTVLILQQLAGELDKLQTALFVPFAEYDPTETFDRTVFDSFQTEVDTLLADVAADTSLSVTLATEVTAVNVMMGTAVTRADAFDAAAEETKNVVADYQKQLTYGDMTSFKEITGRAIEISTAGVLYLDGEGRDKILSNLNVTMDNLIGLIDSYAIYTVAYIDNDFGACFPVYQIYYGLVRSACWMMVDPFNAVWSGLGLTLLLILPMLILACNLATLYKRKGINMGETRGGMRNVRVAPKGEVRATPAALNPVYANTPATPSSEGSPMYTVIPASSVVYTRSPSSGAAQANGGVRIYNPADFHPDYDVGKVYEVPEAYRVLRSNSFTA